MKLFHHILAFCLFLSLGAFAQDHTRNNLPAPDSVSTDTVSKLTSMANVFTPNNDGVNDVLVIYGAGLKTVKLQIFDRWGIKVCDFFGPNDQWDGHNTTGDECQPGVYFFFMTATGVDGQAYEARGTIQLLR
jgi:gliding motility-associated-like protein